MELCFDIKSSGMKNFTFMVFGGDVEIVISSEDDEVIEDTLICQTIPVDFIGELFAVVMG